MTTIAAIQGRDWAVVAYDSQVTEDNGRKYILEPKMAKVCENGPYILGVAGDLRAVNLLAHSFHPPDPGNIFDEDLDRFMVTKFVPSLKKTFDNNFYGKENEHSSNVMVVINSTIYEVGGDYDAVRDEVGLYSLGSGSQYALGSMYQSVQDQTRTLKNARTIAKSAVEIACKLDPGSSGPVRTKVQQWG